MIDIKVIAKLSAEDRKDLKKKLTDLTNAELPFKYDRVNLILEIVEGHIQTAFMEGRKHG